MVAQATPQRLIEMFEVMAELEGMCARLAARRMSDAELAEIEAAHDACRGSAAARDADAYFYANERFHYAIYAASHNTFLFEQASALQRKLRPYRRLQLRVRNRPQRSFEEHQAIVDALREGDADKAVQSHPRPRGRARRALRRPDRQPRTDDGPERAGGRSGRTRSRRLTPAPPTPVDSPSRHPSYPAGRPHPRAPSSCVRRRVA